MATVRHGVTIDLGFDIDDRFRVGLEPSNIDLDVEVTDAGKPTRKHRAILGGRRIRPTWRRWRPQASQKSEHQ